MVRFLVYINNKSKIDDWFLFYAMVQLTKLCLPLINIFLIAFVKSQPVENIYIYIYSPIVYPINNIISNKQYLKIL